MISVQSPSNIALIKYMGKQTSLSDGDANLPENPSLSLTLSGLSTHAFCRLSSHEGTEVFWNPDFIIPISKTDHQDKDPLLRVRTPSIPKLSPEAISRTVKHAHRVRAQMTALFEKFGLGQPKFGKLELICANTFPASAGVASSASSFSAITLAVARTLAASLDQFDQKYRENLEFKREVSRLSRQGSGSSCRSFEGPWVKWEKERGESVSSKLPPLVDIVVLISSETKTVSSSQAHQRVKSSPLWQNRVERATLRFAQLLRGLEAGDLRSVSRLSWSECWEMHSLFHTAEEPFSYWEPGTLDVLKWLSPELKLESPPIVTLDAGPNVHLLVPEEDALAWIEKIQSKFNFELLVDRQGLGAQWS